MGCVGLSKAFVVAPCAFEFLLDLSIFVLDSGHLDGQGSASHEALGALVFGEIAHSHGRLSLILLD